ncbi:uncharacterized protein AB675_4342 [Cyphellophora attinorum]|uniref:Uncharacterized protein n=1 Tax=Cyphellophora attinorum TaxID=1664694 RepID=A0A0N1H4U6_9EURO|nr:uncharacterized protein AB675_4342 [Phialophora attinorum]KPI36505.1 hypothetical protein AB675_4342 [Phialophora attinorum]
MAQDDNIDMAVSPYQTAEDLDIDFDHMEDQYQAPEDDAMNDYQIGEDQADNVMDEQEPAPLNDDDMLEDDHQDYDHNGEETDIGVSAAVDQETVQELVDDEDILYDEEPEDDPNEPLTENAEKATDTYDFALDQDDTHEIADTTTHQDAEQDQTEQSVSAPREEPNTTNLEHEEEPQADPTDASQSKGEDKAAESANTVAEVNEGPLLDLAAIEDSAVESALRSIRVFWDNAEWTLFSTQQDATDCFFRDTSYAYEPMDKFLEACRHVIPGDDLGQHDELTFIIEELGLSICEDSKYAPALTLAHIIELYLTLHRNGSQANVTVIPCVLQSRTCLQTYYAGLLQKAMDGKQLAEVVADVIDSSSDEGVDLGPDGAVDADDHDDLLDDPTGADDADDAAEVDPEAEQQQDHAETTTKTHNEEQTVEGAAHNEAQADVDEQEELHPGENDLLDVFDEEEGNEPADDETAAGDGHDVTEELVDDSSSAFKAEPAQSETAQMFAATPKPFDTLGQGSQAAATPALYEDPGAPAPVSDFDSYNEGEELLRLRQEEFAAQQSELEPQISFGATNGAKEAEWKIEELEHEHEQFEDEILMPAFNDQVAVEEEQPEDELLDFLAPTTPQKGSAKKRKAVQEEDDFDLSAFDTPGPKRRRPS